MELVRMLNFLTMLTCLEKTLGNMYYMQPMQTYPGYIPVQAVPPLSKFSCCGKVYEFLEPIPFGERGKEQPEKDPSPESKEKDSSPESKEKESEPSSEKSTEEAEEFTEGSEMSTESGEPSDSKPKESEEKKESTEKSAQEENKPEKRTEPLPHKVQYLPFAAFPQRMPIVHPPSYQKTPQFYYKAQIPPQVSYVALPEPRTKSPYLPLIIPPPRSFPQKGSGLSYMYAAPMI